MLYHSHVRVAGGAKHGKRHHSNRYIITINSYCVILYMYMYIVYVYCPSRVVLYKRAPIEKGPLYDGSRYV